MSSNVDTAEIDSIGITNQRETTIVWDRATGEPIMNAIVWQCRRTAPMVEAIASDPATAAEITARTGLVPDAYFSASKLAWISGEVPGARARAEAGELAASAPWTAGSSGSSPTGPSHATDVTNASRTMLYNIHERRWDPVSAGALRHPRGHSSRGAPLFRQLRRNGEPGARPGHPHLRRGGRPAGGALRPVLLPCGPGEEHLRHRLLSAHAHRARGLRERARPRDHGGRLGP